MSQAIQRKAPQTEISGQLSGVSSADLRAQLAEALTATATGLARAAMIFEELRRRGEPLPDLRSGLATWLPRIASGELAAEAVIAFAGQKILLHRMGGLDLDEQRRLAAGGLIRVACFDEAGEITSEDKPLARLSAREVLLSVDFGVIRPLSAQIKSLEQSVSRSVTPIGRGPQSTVTIRADPAAGVIQIGHARVRPENLAAALSAMGWVMTKKEARAP